MRVDQQWLVETYDRIVRDGSESGTEVGVSRRALGQAYREAVESGVIERWEDDDLALQGEALYDRFIRPTRERRKSSLRRAMDVLIDAWNGETTIDYETDPLLDHAYPLGNGSDKPLRRWTVDNWHDAVTERYRNCADATAAAREFDERAQLIIDAMVSRSALRVGDVEVAA